MSTRKQKAYNDAELCEDIAQGELSYEQMATKHRLSVSMIGQIARGECRAELQAKIDAISDGLAEQARRLGKRLAGVAMGRLGALAAKNSEANSEVQRKAAVDILKFAIGDPSKPETNVNQTQNMPGLSQEQIDKALSDKEGPE